MKFDDVDSLIKGNWLLKALLIGHPLSLAHPVTNILTLLTKFLVKSLMTSVNWSKV